MDKIITAKEVLQANSNSIATWNNIKDLDKAKDEIVYNIKSKYRDKVWDIERERDNKIKEIEEAEQSEVNLLKLNNESNIALVKKVERILELLKLKSRDLSINDDNVTVRKSYKNNTNQYKESLGYLVNSEHLIIKLYIIGNDKPSNCYSLIAYGNSFFWSRFDNQLMNFNRIGDSLFSAYYKDGTPNIDITIKDFKTVEEARAYYKSKHDVILKNFIAEHNSIELEYQEVIKNYSLSDFRELVVLECPECKKFYTVFDSLSEYNLDTYECNNHDKNIKMVRV